MIKLGLYGFGFTGDDQIVFMTSKASRELFVLREANG